MRTFRALVVVTFACHLVLSSPAVAEPRLPARCIHAIGSATLAVGNLVSDQIIELEGTRGIPLAHDAVELALQLKCPSKMILNSIDCVVALVHSSNKRPEISDVLQCVKDVTGQAMFESK